MPKKRLYCGTDSDGGDWSRVKGVHPNDGTTERRNNGTTEQRNDEPHDLTQRTRRTQRSQRTTEPLDYGVALIWWTPQIFGAEVFMVRKSTTARRHTPAFKYEAIRVLQNRLAM